MNLSNLSKLTKNKIRKGRGISAGQGKTAGRGTKGQKSRTGKKLRPGFEGGQMPLAQRLPKNRGFKSRNIKPQTIRLEKLNNLKDGAVVTIELLRAEHIIRSNEAKIVVGGELTKKLTVNIPATKSAIVQIEKAGGKHEIVKSGK
jgi:large subunit ribosomal protein L15